MIILNKKFAHAGQDFDIFIKYDEGEKKPVEVKNIMLHTHGNWYPVGTIMNKFFKDAVWQLITETDWEEVRREMEADTNKISDMLHPVMTAALRPFIVTGGEAKTINN
jgi:hypothetical protein